MPDERGPSAIRLVSIYPMLLGTYGDGGNLRVLAQRARLRGLAVEAIELDAGAPVPAGADLYLLGGGEDGAQVAAARALRSHGGLGRAVEAGAVVFAVCAGYQVLGERFPGIDGVAEPGLGVLDVTTTRLPTRAVGELLARPVGGDGVPSGVDATTRTGAPALTEPLTGYENHAGGTTVGAAARPLAIVDVGVGNGTSDAAGRRGEGAVQGRIVGTYLHGPGLARNPQLADLLLSWVVGAALSPLDLGDVAALRAERLAAVGTGPGTARAGRAVS
jgi:CobQ-like glutamine amidotransferase family enzyme